MVNALENKIYALVRRYDGVYLFKSRQPVLTPDTDLDLDLNFEEEEAEALMDEFFAVFDIDKNCFDIKNYYPEIPFSWNPIKKSAPVPVPKLTIGMLIQSAKAGRWLYS